MSWEEEGGDEEKGLPESNGTNEVLGRQTVSRHVARLVLVHGKKNMWHRIGTPAGNAKISALMRLAAAARWKCLWSCGPSKVLIWFPPGLAITAHTAPRHIEEAQTPRQRPILDPPSPVIGSQASWVSHPRHHGLQRSAFCPPPPPGQSSSHPCSPPGLLRARLDTRTRVPSNNGQLHPQPSPLQ